MSDTRYTIKHADGDITVDGAVSDVPEADPGDTISYEFVVRTGASSAALDDLLAFASYAGSDIAGTAEFGVPFFREQLPSDAPVSTNVVQVEPGDGIAAAPTLWGLVRAVELNSARTGSQARVTVELFVLGDTAAYADETALRSALEETV